LVNPTNKTVGTATAIVQYNIGNAAVQPLNICVIVSGNYLLNSPFGSRGRCGEPSRDITEAALWRTGLRRTSLTHLVHPKRANSTVVATDDHADVEWLHRGITNVVLHDRRGRPDRLVRGVDQPDWKVRRTGYRRVAIVRVADGKSDLGGADVAETTVADVLTVALRSSWRCCYWGP